MDKNKLMNDQSKNRLKRDVKKRIRTTMVGSLASVELFFGHLWGDDPNDRTPEQKEMFEVFEQLRTEILDKGNNQIRLMESEIDNYDVKWNKFHINIPIQRIKRNKRTEQR